MNHLDLVGWISAARYKWAEIMGKEIKFRPGTFYLGIVDMLAREVEHQKDGGLERTEETREEIEGVPTEQDGKLNGHRKEEQEREQMIHSLEDAGAEVNDTRHSAGTRAAEGSKSTSGSTTPRA